mmetsp:Transcript_33797/g.48938  ORF Transcript_33797/g.48938 Transcript_33797/m.48938 type:complete len:365 (-) Transcript_33797:1004-2098(-)
MDLKDCTDCGASEGSDCGRFEYYRKNTLKMEKLPNEAFVIPSYNFWDMLWKTKIGFCDARDNLDNASGISTKISEATSTSKHRRNNNVLFDLVPKNIITDFDSVDDVHSPLASPTELFSTPIKESHDYKTPSKPKKATDKKVPEVERNKFKFPTFRSDRNIVRVLFGGENFRNADAKSKTKNTEQSQTETDALIFRGWCLFIENCSEPPDCLISYENLRFIELDDRHNVMNVSEREGADEVEKLNIHPSFSLSSFTVDKKWGRGIIMESTTSESTTSESCGDFDEVTERIFILPLDYDDDCKPSRLQFEARVQGGKNSDDPDDEWGTTEYLEDNFATSAQNDRHLHLRFSLDAMMFKQSDYYDG